MKKYCFIFHCRAKTSILHFIMSSRFWGHLCQETFHSIQPASVEEVHGSVKWGRRGRSDSRTGGQRVQLWGLDSLREGIKGGTWSLPGGLWWTRVWLVPSWLAGSCSRNSSCYSRHLALLQTGWAVREQATHKHKLPPSRTDMASRIIWVMMRGCKGEGERICSPF